MSENKLTQGELLEELDNMCPSVVMGEKLGTVRIGRIEQAYNQIKKMIENYDEVQAFAMEIIEGKQQKLTVTLAEIRELSTRLRDTSRQSLYETKLKRWLESKGFVIIG